MHVPFGHFWGIYLKNIYWSTVCIGGDHHRKKERRRDTEEESEGQKQGKESNPGETCVSINRKLFNKMQGIHLMDYHINIKGMNSSYSY